MKDIHTHILDNLDDGAKTLNESLEILEKAYQNGFKDIILTPHYIKNSIYSANNQEKLRKLEILQKELQKRNILINLYLGNEVYIDEDIIELFENLEISTLNNSKYILIELPLNNKTLILDEVLYKLKKANLVPIIAHPERYLNYYKDYDFFASLIKKGCLLQGNIKSLYGKYGRKSKKMFKELLKRNMFHFLGSDIHHEQDDIYLKNMRKDVLKIVKNQDIVDNLFEKNIDKVLKNQEIK